MSEWKITGIAEKRSGRVRRHKGKRGLTASVYARSISRNGGDEDNSAPALRLHVLYAALDEEEGGPGVDVQGVLEFREGDISVRPSAFMPVSWRGWNEMLGTSRDEL